MICKDWKRGQTWQGGFPHRRRPRARWRWPSAWSPSTEEATHPPHSKDENDNDKGYWRWEQRWHQTWKWKREWRDLSPETADQQGVGERREVRVEGVGGEPRQEGEDQAEQLGGEGGDGQCLSIGHPQLAEDQHWLDPNFLLFTILTWIDLGPEHKGNHIRWIYKSQF